MGRRIEKTMNVYITKCKESLLVYGTLEKAINKFQITLRKEHGSTICSVMYEEYIKSSEYKKLVDTKYPSFEKSFHLFLFQEDINLL